MSAKESLPPNPPARLSELVSMAAAFLLFFAAQVVFTDSAADFTRKFWLDELLTHARVTAPFPSPFAQVLVNAGFDCTPPTYYVLLRAWTALLGDSGEFALRCFSVFATVAALVGMYALVRQVAAPEVALAAGLAVGACPLTIELAFMARCYALWLAATVWYAYFLQRACTPGHRPFCHVAVALLAALVCTIHWFGILALGLVTGAQLLAGGQPLRTSLRVLASAGCGPLALAACLPILFRQRAVYTTPSWIPSPNLLLVLGFLRWILPTLVIAVCLVWFLLARLLDHRRQGPNPAEVPPLAWRPLAGLLGLVLLPVVIVILSFVLVPVMGSVYSLPVVAALGAGVGLLYARASRPVLVVLCVLLLLAGAWEMHRFTAEKKEDEARVDRLIRSLRALPSNQHIVFEDAGLLLEVGHYAPDLRGRCYFFQFEETRPGGLNPAFRHEREMVADFARWHGGPGVLGFESLRTERRFVVVMVPGSEPARLADDHPGYRIDRVEGNVYRLTKAE